MNILGGGGLGKTKTRMVNFVEPSAYLFGTSNFETSCQQGGVYNRDFVGVRIERVSPVRCFARAVFVTADHVNTYLTHPLV